MKQIPKEETKSKGNDKPVYRFQAGNCSASIFKNTAVIDGKNIDVFNVVLQKSYMNEKNEWENTNQYGKQDLVKARLVIDKCIDFLYTTEQ